MSQSYLDIAKQGKNSRWRYRLAILLILLFWIVGSLLALIFIGIFLPDLQQRADVFEQSRSVGVYVAKNIPAIFLCLGIFLAVRCVHQRKCLTLISADSSVNLKRLLQGFGVWFLLDATYIGVELLLAPQDYSFTFAPTPWFQLLPVALVLTPIQTTAEELLFRGYLLQALSRITRQPLVLIIITSLLFAVPHFAHPEMQRGAVWIALDYFAFGVFTSLLTLSDNRLELALAVHAAYNLFIVLFVNSEDSALPTPAVWTVEPGDPRLTLVLTLVQMAVFYYVFFGRRRKLAP